MNQQHTKEAFIEKLRKEEYSRVAILGHTSVDPDALASALGLKFIVQHFHPNAKVDLLIDGISKPTVQLVDFLDVKYLEQTKDHYDLIIITDVNIPNQFGVFKELVLEHSIDQLVILDHHTPTEFSEKSVAVAYIEDERTSCAEMVSELIFSLELKPSVKILTALLCGILYDSRRFYKMNLRLLNVVNQLLVHGADYDTAIKLIQRKFGHSERIARLKAASRLQIQKINGWVICWSRIGSHEGTSARGLLDLGADVAIMYSHKNNKTRLNIRATGDFYRQTTIHFGKDLMAMLGDHFNGEGGGHPTAAALNIPSSIPEKTLKQKSLNFLRKELRDKKKS